MGILGLTHDENRSALEKLQVTSKVAIGGGSGAGSENGHPRRLDHFVFKWRCDVGPVPEISQAQREKPTELGIPFLNDNPREVSFEQSTLCGRRPAASARGELVQVANGGRPLETQATRRMQEHPRATAWELQVRRRTAPFLFLALN